MRLCLAKKDYVRTEIVANKVNVKILNEEKHQVCLSVFVFVSFVLFAS